MLFCIPSGTAAAHHSPPARHTLSAPGSTCAPRRPRCLLTWITPAAAAQAKADSIAWTQLQTPIAFAYYHGKPEAARPSLSLPGRRTPDLGHRRRPILNTIVVLNTARRWTMRADQGQGRAPTPTTTTV